MLPEREYKRWKAVILNSANQGDILSDSEITFLSDLETKFEKYRRSTFLSEKQTDWLSRIEDRLKQELGGAYED